MNHVNGLEWVWSPVAYSKNSSVQELAAKALIEAADLKGDEQILDLGCGDGKITKFIKSRLTSGAVLGIDCSPEMIEHATKTHCTQSDPHLCFRLEDAQQISYIHQFHVVFSSFALQWVPDLAGTFCRIRQSLGDGGRFIATIPLSISSELDDALRKIVNTKRWGSFFYDRSIEINMPSESAYKTHLNNNLFSMQHELVCTQDIVFSSESIFKQYIAQWLPHLSSIPSDMIALFLDDLVSIYLTQRPLDAQKQLHFTYSRFDFITRPVDAYKVGESVYSGSSALQPC